MPDKSQMFLMILTILISQPLKMDTMQCLAHSVNGGRWTGPINHECVSYDVMILTILISQPLPNQIN